MKKKKNKRSWTYYFLELLVVFIGVTAGFLLNNWRDDNAELRLEKKYLESFYADVETDAIDLDSLIIRNQTKADTLIGILRKSVHTILSRTRWPMLNNFTANTWTIMVFRFCIKLTTC